MKNKKTIVTGGLEFIGSNFVEKLIFENGVHVLTINLLENWYLFVNNRIGC